MKKTIFIMFLILAFGIANTYAQELKTGKKVRTETKVEQKAKTQAAAKTTKAPKPIKGTVINLVDYLSGGKGIVTKDQAKKLLDYGMPVAFMASGKGGKIYLVVNQDGSTASKKLADLAGNPVGIIGTTKTRSGMNILIASMIEVMK
jgi:hypothetical protein